MRVISILLVFFLMSISLCQSASAGVGSVAYLTCGSAPVGVTQNGQAVVLHVNYVVGSDAGTPGLFWLGVLSTDQTQGAVLTAQGWTTYQGGLYPFQARYDRGLPAVISLEIPFPGGGLTASPYEGFNVYVGHGGYGAQSVAKVTARRQALDSAKDMLMAKGAWTQEMQTDDRYIWSLIQQDMTDKGKYGVLLSIPRIDCVRPSWG